MNEHANNLRSIAQNDYMIDQHFLPDGKALNEAADRIEELEAIVARLPKTADGVVVTPGTMVYNHTGKVGFRVATYGGDDGRGGCLWYAPYGGPATYTPVYSTREAAEQARAANE